MADYPFRPIDVAWKRPPIDREILKTCTKRSDFKGLWHSLGVLAVLGLSGAFAYTMFASQRWVLLALALYIHGGLFAFSPQTHEFSHGTVFKTTWLNRLFKRIYGIVHWNGNLALYKMSHTYHHLYTLHRESEGEVVLPQPEFAEQIFHRALYFADPVGLVTTIYDQIYSLFVPFLSNTRRTTWQRYVYSVNSRREQRNVFWTTLSQLLFHIAFAVLAIAIGKWFLIVVVSLPAFYGGKWYSMWVHDTMHVGKEPETEDFRLSCRSVRLDPFTSFMYWHMEWHTEHHTYAAIPCYNLKKFYRLTREHWEKPQTLFQAWREMNRSSKNLVAIPVKV